MIHALFMTMNLILAQAAFAQNAGNESQVVLQQDTQESPIVVAHNQWTFLGCVHNEDECHHYAHDQGYIDYFSQYDRYTCHHGDETHVCWGR